ncbi:TerC/Alx family metal homeostasis membrane protein [Candidatus Clostridium radicumherbarum]|uniref:TerC/Alx family metal homeostasis membrane protein n=1 Tax=Candidatus Clostridium radicumherbarum TaxID=3381662 RepID=A0ABW8TQ82_9CLOT
MKYVRGGDNLKVKNAMFMVLFWICMALLFNFGIYMFQGSEKALQFLGGYVIELSLSMDNLFLFLLIFEAFKIPSIYQKRVLSFGIFGAILLRFIFTMLGVTIVNRFHFVLYIFGIVLLISGYKMMFGNEEDKNYRDSKIMKVLGKVIPITNSLHGEKFFVKIDKVLYATPLFAILVLIEFSDILFAIDSIPAIFSITTNPFIVYTSNIFAILGLRSFYFVLQKLNNLFCYVKYGVALILSFTGIKLLLLMFNLEISLPISLGIIFTVLALSILCSVLFPNKSQRKVENF